MSFIYCLFNPPKLKENNLGFAIKQSMGYCFFLLLYYITALYILTDSFIPLRKSIKMNPVFLFIQSHALQIIHKRRSSLLSFSLVKYSWSVSLVFLFNKANTACSHCLHHPHSLIAHNLNKQEKVFKDILQCGLFFSAWYEEINGLFAFHSLRGPKWNSAANMQNM